MKNEKQIREFVDYLNQRREGIYNFSGLRPLGKANEINLVSDSPDKYYLPGLHERDNAVLMVSNKQFPDFIARATDIIKQIRQMVTEGPRDTILNTVAEGYFKGQSFAVWLEYQPLSEHKIIRAIQKRFIHGKVFSFLRQLAKDGLTADLTPEKIIEHIDAPLRCVAENSRQSNQIRSHSEKALKKLDAGEWVPVTTIQHSDFWLGNILLQKSKHRPLKNDYGFYVIDWSGASLNGAPIFDFIRYCMSSNISTARARKELLKYSQFIDVSQDELLFYLLVALGNIGLNLEEFPEERYLKMCDNCLSYYLEI